MSSPAVNSGSTQSHRRTDPIPAAESSSRITPKNAAETSAVSVTLTVAYPGAASSAASPRIETHEAHLTAAVGASSPTPPFASESAYLRHAARIFIRSSASSPSRRRSRRTEPSAAR